MSKRDNIRAWINKNNGSFYQIDNQNLTLFEVIGYLIFVASLIIYLIHDKAEFKETWIGWLFLVSGFILALVGIKKRIKKDENT
jgi:hypothetical protein